MTIDLVRLTEEGNMHLIRSNHIEAEVREFGSVVIKQPTWGIIPTDSMVGFFLDENTRRIHLIHNCTTGSRKIYFGVVEDYETGVNWIKRVNELYKNPPEVSSGVQGAWEFDRGEY